MGERVLVTNDDGIDAPGINVLIGELVERGYEPFVVAPNADYSGAGTSVLGFSGQSATRHYERRTLDVAPDVEAIALDGPPAMCVLLAMREVFGPMPELVASGINYGLNVGTSVTHSGTVSAAMAAGRWPVPALAVSADVDWTVEDNQPRYDTAASLAVDVLDVLSRSTSNVVNLNVPNCDLSAVRGVRSATLSAVTRFRSNVLSDTGSALEMEYISTGAEVEPGSDTALVEQGYAAITSLTGITAAPCDELVRQLQERAG